MAARQQPPANPAKPVTTGVIVLKFLIAIILIVGLCWEAKYRHDKEAAKVASEVMQKNNGGGK